MNQGESPAGPNAVSSGWFKEHRGHRISISPVPAEIGDGVGILKRWDPYSVLLERAPGGVDVLIKQGPGMIFRCLTCLQAAKNDQDRSQTP